MAHPFHHAESSARRFGGKPEDYLAIHSWFDASKMHLALPVHRALRHHTAGIFEAEERFGVTLTNSAGRIVPVRFIGEQHVKEDCQGRVPSLADWLMRIEPAAWMGNGHIEAPADLPAGDPALLWRQDVAEGRTLLGLADWIAQRTAHRAA